ncbi:hypothetical protein DPMN_109615 [Dreissena polymorpha]|uniref:Uncharacterized protein n=1 Tax=Dreissena polymorpha TaxID=45954 RepID=A0A9D4KB23_DREPO|nr:hypothetical protein DPMN_109615 [Dreissena polymorpha]
MGSLSSCITGTCCTNAKETVSMGCQTNQQTGQKQYVLHYYSGGHKNASARKEAYRKNAYYIDGLINTAIDFNQMLSKRAFVTPDLKGVNTNPNNKILLGQNLLTKFHEDRTVNVASREKFPAPWKPFFQANIIIFELIQDIILTKFHEDWTINVASRVFKMKNAPPLVAMFFKETKTIFKLIQDIIGTNLLTKFHDDRKINVTYSVNKPRPRGGHVFQPTSIIFELVQDIIGMNLLTEFHEDQTINVASRVKNAPPLGGHVFQANVTIFELIQDIIKTNLLIIFHQDLTINVASRPYKGKMPQPTGIIFELVQDIIGMNLLTKFHEDWTINVASRVLTRFYYSHIRKNSPPLGSHVFQAKVTMLTRKNAPLPGGHFYGDQTITVASRVKNAPPLGSHVFQANVTILKLIQDIIETNLLTKFHEDWK